MVVLKIFVRVMIYVILRAQRFRELLLFFSAQLFLIGFVHLKHSSPNFLSTRLVNKNINVTYYYYYYYFIRILSLNCSSTNLCYSKCQIFFLFNLNKFIIIFNYKIWNSYAIFVTCTPSKVYNFSDVEASILF